MHNTAVVVAAVITAVAAVGAITVAAVMAAAIMDIGPYEMLVANKENKENSKDNRGPKDHGDSVQARNE